MSEQTQTDDFAAIAKPHPAPQAKSPAVKTAPGDDFAHIAKPPPSAGPADDGGTSDDSGTSLADLSASNPNSEGLYHMKDAQGHSYAVPFSNVTMADDYENSFVDEKERAHFEKDLKAKDPSLWTRLRNKVNAVTEPTTTFSGEPFTGMANDPASQEAALNVLKRTGRGLFGIVDMAPQMLTAFQNAVSDDPAKQKEGNDAINAAHPGAQVADRVKEFREDWKKDPKLAVANTAGDALTIYIADKAMEAVKASPEALRSGKERVVENLKNRAGTGVKSTEKYVRDTALKNDEIIANGKSEYDKDHADKVKVVREANDAKQTEYEKAKRQRNDIERQRVDLNEKAAKARTQLHNHVKGIGEAGAKWFDQQYDKLGKMTEGTKVDLTPLVEAVEEGKLNDIAGSQTGVPIFEDVLKRGKGEAGAGGEKPKGWESMSPDEKQEWATQTSNDRGISYKDLTGYWRELGKIIRSPGTMDDIRTAAVKVRGTIEEMQRELVKKADEETAAKAARDHKQKPSSVSGLNYSIAQKYKSFAESYRDPGSVGTRAMNSDNAVEATKPYLAAKTTEELSDLKRQTVGREEKIEGKTTNATEWAGRNSADDSAGKRLTTKQRRAQTEKLIDQVRKVHENLEALGNPKPPPSLPEVTPEPEYTPPQPETLSQKDLELYKRKQLNERIDQMENGGIRFGIKGLGTLGAAELVSHLMGFGAQGMESIAMGAATAAVVGPKVIAWLLKKPGVSDMLTRITKADVEALEKLPANQRVEAEQTIINMTQQAKSSGVIPQNRPTPMAAFAKQDLPKAKAEAAKMAESEKVVEPAEPERDVEEVKLPVEKPAEAATEDRSDHTPEWAHDRNEVRTWNESSAPVKTHEVGGRKLLSRLTDENTVQVRIVGDSGKVVGRVELNFDPEKPSEPAFTDSAFVDEGERGKGLAKSLYKALPDIAKEYGIKGVESSGVKTDEGHGVWQSLEKSGHAQSIGKGRFKLGPSKAEPAAAPPSPTPAPAETAPRNDVTPSRRLEDLKVDAKRFQYKLGGNKQGVTDTLSDAKWEQHLADPIHIWEDPETGEEFVINGHHRYDLAQKAGAERINVQKIDNTEWPDAAAARRFGALKNIADGNGTSVDAAKFLREKGYTLDELRETGLSLKKGVAKDGVALSKLTDDLFDRVVDGQIDPRIGAAIGEASDVASDQEAILKDVQRREKAGRPVSPEQIRESARLIKAAPTRTETSQDLFGNHEEDRNLFLEMGEVSEYIQKELADEKRVFKRVATKGAAEQLAKADNVINTEKSATAASQAAQQRELYLKRSAQAGPINAALQEAAQRLAEGDNPNAVKQNAFDEIREHLAEELGHAKP